MSTEEPDSVAQTPSSQLPMLANALQLGIVQDKLMGGLRSNAVEMAEQSVGE